MTTMQPFERTSESYRRDVAISVVMPAFNAVAYIRDALESVLAQTFPVAEVIVVDDGSTDGTADAVRKLGGGIRLITESKAGVSAARNRAAGLARGEWLGFIDADDLWVRHKLERQVALVDDNVHLVYSDRVNFGAIGGLPPVQSALKPMPFGDVLRSLLIDGNAITTSSVLIRRRVFLELGGFCEQLPVAEDYDLWLRFAANYPVAFCAEPLVRYRIHEAGSSQNPEVMNAARVRVLKRAQERGSFRRLTLIERRKVWAQAWATNGWDAARHKRRWPASRCYLRAIASWPLSIPQYRAFVSVLLGAS